MTRTHLVTGIAVAAALVVVAIFFVFSNPFTSSTGLDMQNTATTTPGDASQLVVQDEQVGTGAVAQIGDTLSVDYTGRLQDGTVFDTSTGKAPFQFVLGHGDVIPGWDQGLQGMKVGGKRLLIVPPGLAYGPNDYGPIPGNSTLVFEVTLRKVTPAGSAAAAPEGPGAN